jgi:2-haloacid dehalogenase
VIKPDIDAIVFDLGGVLIDWNPRYLYRRVFDDDDAMELFLATVATSAWIIAMDAGEPMADAVARLAARHPAQRRAIEAFLTRWQETHRGAIADAVLLLGELHARAWPLYALTNWSAETFPVMRPHFPFLEWFRGIVVSGEEGLVKPDPRLFHRMLDRYGLVPGRTVYIDDSRPNVVMAETIGFHAVHCRSTAGLRADLARLGVL